ncbi:MAG: hypothetical protein KJ043_02020 [Anaerolineae bacterium]|nr:hypothetical protein [Anaerolineae bacterium]
MMNNRFVRLLWASSPLLLAIGLYGYVVYLPFFLDDGLLFEIILRPPNSPLSWEIWGGSMTFAYYRPLVFTVWEINQSLMGGGRFDPIGLHWLNLMLYGMTGVILGAFIRRVAKIWALPYRHTLGGLIGIIFVIFPFNYNAVMWVASMFHIASAFGTVVALWCVVMVFDKSNKWLLGAWLGVFIATFSHENGVLLAPIIGLLIIGISGRKMMTHRPTMIRALVLYIPILLIIGIYWWLLNTVPRGASPLTILWDDIPNSFALFLQTFAYPIMGAYRKITLADESISMLWILGLATLIPAFLFIVWQSRKMGIIALFGVMWFIIASAPSIAFLSTDYVRGSWRLMLFASVGIALFWGMFIIALWRSGKIGRVVMILFIGWSAFMSLDFLGQRQHEAILQANYNDKLQTLIQIYTQGKPLVVNAPSFLASTTDQQWLPTRETGVMFHAEYINHAQVFRAQTGYDFPRIETTIDYDIFGAPPTQNFAPYTTLGVSKIEAVKNASDIYVTFWDGEQFRPMFVGGAGYGGSNEPIALFPDVSIALTETSAERTTPYMLQFRTRWRVDNPPSDLIFLVLDAFCDGERVGQSIGAIWGGTYAFHHWSAGEIQTDFRDVGLIRDVPDDCLSLQVSLIDWDGNGTPYPVFTPDGEPIGTAHGENRVAVMLMGDR